MNEILKTIQHKVGESNLSDSCSRHGCKVSLERVPFPRVIVNADAPSLTPNEEDRMKRCDYVLFFMNSEDNTLVIAPMELKSGNVDASDVVVQLTWGVEFAASVAPEVPTPIRCQPLLFHGRRIHKSQNRKLNLAKLRFRGVDLTIITEHCDDRRNLANALSK